jgi:hypothetical protein
LPGHGQLCGCTTQLVSGKMYADFIAALDDELLSLYPHGGMIHLAAPTRSTWPPGGRCRPSARSSSTTALPRTWRPVFTACGRIS